MTKEEKYSLAEWAMEHALKCGASEAAATINEDISSQVEVREKRIEKLEEAHRNSMYIRLFVDNRYASVATSRFTGKDQLGKFIRDAVEATRHLEKDPFRHLPDPSLYPGRENKDLRTADPGYHQVSPGTKIDHAHFIEQEVVGKDERIISVTSSYRDIYSGKVMVTSNGFRGDHERSRFSGVAMVSVKSGEARPQAYWYESSVFHPELRIPGIGTTALKRALDKAGQSKIRSGKYTMIIENRQAGQVLQPLIQALQGRSLSQKESFLNRMKGKTIGSNVLNLVDDPFIESGRGSGYFDSEGMATRKRTIIKSGILREYYIDTYYGGKLDMEPTSGETTNLVLQPGVRDLKRILGEQDQAILVTGFNGGNSSGNTGDFSYGIEGFLVENGDVSRPVSEMNITGNFRELWENLSEAGSDLYTGSPWRLPSLAFEKVDFSGT